MKVTRGWLAILDALLITCAFFLAFAVRIQFKYLEYALPQYLRFLIPFLLLRLAVLGLFGVYKPTRASEGIREFLRIVAAVAFGSFIATMILIFMNLASPMVFPRSVILFEWALSTALLTGARFTLRILDLRLYEPEPDDDPWTRLEAAHSHVWRYPESTKARIHTEAEDVIEALPLPASTEVRPATSPALAIKRVADIAGAGLILLALAPVLALVALAIWLESGQPILHRTARYGVGGRVFTMYKFRTMVQDAHKRLPDVQHLNVAQGMIKIPNDPRVTRVGKLLRRYSVDELPNLLNVLVGDMSLIGPRPHEVHDISLNDPLHRLRLAMRPGLTGLWQVTTRDHPSLAVRVYYDLAYVCQWSLWLDAKILLRTVGVVLKGSGGHVTHHALVSPPGAHEAIGSGSGRDEERRAAARR